MSLPVCGPEAARCVAQDAGGTAGEGGIPTQVEPKVTLCVMLLSWGLEVGFSAPLLLISQMNFSSLK